MNKAERTKQNIIDKASLLYNRKGIAGTTVTEVLQEAKVARGCLYHHFESSEDLSFQTVDFLLGKMTGKISEVVSREKTAKGKLLAYLDFNKNPINAFLEGGCPIINFAVEADDNNVMIKSKLRQVLMDSQQKFVNLVKDGIANGEFSKSLDAEMFCFKIFAAIEGATVFCRVLGSNDPMEKLIDEFKKEIETYAP